MGQCLFLCGHKYVTRVVLERTGRRRRPAGGPHYAMRAGSRPATDRQVRETLLLPMMTNATLTELRSMPKIAREELSGHSSSSDDRD
jgi:hypothetical protein